MKHLQRYFFIFVWICAFQGQAYDEKAMDKSVNPCVDFYSYACGSWVKSFELPEGYPHWVLSFSEMDKKVLEKIETIFKNLKNNPSERKKAHDGEKLSTFYETCLDEKKLSTDGPLFVKETLERIESFQNQSQPIETTIAYLHQMGVAVFFEISSDEDAKNSSLMRGDIDKSGLGLPEKDYYIAEDKALLRKEYIAHIARMLILGGESQVDAERNAETIFQYEKALAEESLRAVDRTEPKKVYHPLVRSEFQQQYPGFNWELYLTSIGAKAQKIHFNVSEVAYIKYFARTIQALPQKTIKEYIRWRFLSSYAKFLHKGFEDENFNFYGKTLLGIKENKPRSRRCIEATNYALGEAVGREYVRKYFKEKKKKAIDDMIESIRAAFRKNISELSWMDASTKKKALIKLEAIRKKIAYPSHWRNYDDLVVESSYPKNHSHAASFNLRYQLNKIDSPKDYSLWDNIFSHTLNAYYSPNLNEIVLPAAIISEPLFDEQASATNLNYGAIGAVIGHELVHGFDVEGRQFDEKGNLVDWWSRETETKYLEKTKCLVDQYSRYETSGLHMNGILTLGENTADLGGLKMSYMAFVQKLKKEGKDITVSQSASKHPKHMTEMQKFFVSFAQLWCTKATSEFEKFLINTNVHTIGKYRVLGVLHNFTPFEEAFSCQPLSLPPPNMNACIVW